MLKKIVLTIAILALAANSFAGATAKTAACLSNDGTSFAAVNIKFVPSKSVVLGYASGYPSGASGTTASVYSIAAKNKAGDLTYATTSASTAIVKSATLGAGSDLATTSMPTLPADANDSTIAGGVANWSVL